MPGRSRRVLALLLLLALVGAACGNDGGSPHAAAESTDPASTETPATTTSLPPGGRQPTVDDPLRVTFAGDSVMYEFAAAMIAALEGTGETRARFVLSPSVARGGAGGVIWNQELRDHDPDLIVLLVGFWEDQIVGPDASALPGWRAHYRADVVDPFLDLITAQGAKVLWLGMAAVRDPVATSRLVRLNAAWAEAAHERDDVDFLPSGQYLSGPEGGYADSVLSAETGTPVRIRRLDGLHLCPEGIALLGAPVLDRIAEQWNVSAVYGWQQGQWREPPLLEAPEECPAPV